MTRDEDAEARWDALTLLTLGSARLFGPATPAGRPLLDLGKPLALLAFLAASPGRTARRERLIDLLWADLEPDAAKHAVRQTLWYLKKRVGDGIVAANGDALTLDARVACDRDALLAAADSNDHEQVVARFGGDFLPDFATPGGAEFERWADIERRRLRHIFLRSAESHVRDLLSKGRARDAVALARRARDLEPLHQAGWRLVLESLTAARDWPQAQLEGDRFERYLADEELEAEPASRAQLRVARQGGAAAAPDPESPSFTAELVGRERDFARLLDAAEAAQRGRGTHIHVHAPAGIGKSRLLLDVHARLRSTRSRVVLVRCEIGSRDLPYAAANDVALALARLPGARGISPDSASALVAMAPTLSTWFTVPNDGTQGEEALRRRTLALLELTAAVAEEHPLVLLIDDVHWMDLPSRRMLVQLAARGAELPLLLVTAGRPVAGGRLSSEATATLELDPLDEQQCLALVCSIASIGDTSWGGRFASQLWRATSGSPLQILESLQLLMERSLLWVEGGEWRTSSPDDVLGVLGEGGALERRVEALPHDERWLVTLLAVAGAPLPAPILCDAAGALGDRWLDALASLERRGLAARTGGEWQLAHDQMHDAALARAAPEEVRAAHAALGRRLWQEGEIDARAMRRAAHHLAQGGEEAPLAALHHRFVRHLRSLGDSRPLHALAGDLLGPHASDARSRALVRSLPLHVRAGLTSARHVAAVLLLGVALPTLVAATSWSLLRRPARMVETTLLAMVSDSAQTRVVRVPIFRDEWQRAAPVTIDLSNTDDAEVEVPGRPDNLALRPMGNEWLTTQVVSDSGVNDVFLLRRGRPPWRLTFSPGDDNAASWSPDGRFVVHTTARWRPQDSHYDLAIVDVTRGSVRALTRGDPSDQGATWSPRGHRIAFRRRYWDGSPNAVCTVAFDGRDSSCVVPRDATLGDLGTWYDEETVIVSVSRGDEVHVAFLKLTDGSWRSLQRIRRGATWTSSPDGRWVACRCDRFGVGSRDWHLIPTGSPGEGRLLRIEGLREQEHVVFRFAATSAEGLVDSVRVVGGAQPLVAGVPHRLRLDASSRSGETVSLAPVRWSVDDSSVATVDASSGIVRPRRPGTVRVAASLGGWRSASTSLSVTRPDTVLVLREDWSQGIGSTWLSVGDPSSRVVPGDRGPALFIAGDGSYVSGGVAATPTPTNLGLVLEAQLSMPITKVQWQGLSAALMVFGEGSALDESNRRRGAFPNVTPLCNFGFPAREGHRNVDSLPITVGDVRHEAPAPAGLATGRWQELTLVLLPDGRCATLLNGRLVGLVDGGVPRAQAAHLALTGMSDGTRILVGPVRLLRGIPPRIAERLATTP